MTKQEAADLIRSKYINADGGGKIDSIHENNDNEPLVLALYLLLFHKNKLLTSTDCKQALKFIDNCEISAGNYRRNVSNNKYDDSSDNRIGRLMIEIGRAHV